MLGFMLFIFCMTLYMKYIIFNCYSKVRTYFLRKLSLRSFYCDGIIRAYGYLNPLRYMNW